MERAKKSLSTLLLVPLLALPVGLGAAEQQAKKGQKATPLPGTAITLTKRKDDGPYGTSAYSFRYLSQDVAVHKNDVDLVFNQCGQLHVAPQGGLKNRIARVKGMALGDALNFPEQGWITKSFEPEKDAVYIMEVDDGTTHLRLRLHVSAITETEVHFEWTPFRDVAKGTSGTLGACSGKHGSD